MQEQSGEASSSGARVWRCRCGWETEGEPEELGRHCGLNIGNTAHGPVGLVDTTTGEKLLAYNPYVFRGRWRLLLSGETTVADLHREALRLNSNNPPTRTRRRSKLPVVQPVSVGSRNGSSILQESGSSVLSNGASLDGSELETVGPKKGEKRTQVKVQYRPQVFEMDESVVHLYHLFGASVRQMGLHYAPTLGEWIRDVVFQYFLQPPGQAILDLRTLFTEEERAALMEEVR